MIEAQSASNVNTVAVVGAAIAAVAALLGVVLTAWFGSRRDRRTWLRDQRLAHAINILNVAAEMVELIREMREAHGEHTAWHAKFEAFENKTGNVSDEIDDSPDQLKNELDHIHEEMSKSHENLRRAADRMSELIDRLRSGDSEISLLMSLTAVTRYAEMRRSLATASRAIVDCLGASTIPAEVDRVVERESTQIEKTRQRLILVFRKELGNDSTTETLRAMPTLFTRLWRRH